MGDGVNEPLWQPAVSVELTALELLDLVDAHLLRAANAARNGQGEVQRLHEARAGELRQKVASVAPHLLVPDGTDTA